MAITNPSPAHIEALKNQYPPPLVANNGGGGGGAIDDDAAARHAADLWGPIPTGNGVDGMLWGTDEDKAALYKYIMSRKKGLAPDLAGQTWQAWQLVMNMAPNAPDSGANVVCHAVGLLINNNLSGDASIGLVSVLNQLRGVLLTKNAAGVGVRGIGIPRRLAQALQGAVLSRPDVKEAIAANLHRGSLGHGVSGGPEIAAHVARLLLNETGTFRICLVADLANMYGAYNQDCLMDAAHRTHPLLWRLAQMQYANPAEATYWPGKQHETVLRHHVGTPQGMPLSSALANLAWSTVLSQALAANPATYVENIHDDTYLFGTPADVNKLLCDIMDIARALNTNVKPNLGKFKIYTPNPDQRDAVREYFKNETGPLQGLDIDTHADSVVVAGTPVGSSQAQRAFVANATDKATGLLAGIASLATNQLAPGGRDATAALLPVHLHGLARSVVASRVAHLARTVQPGDVNGATAQLGNALADFAVKTLAGKTDIADPVHEARSHAIALLPVSRGGLGLGAFHASNNTAAYAASVIAASPHIRDHLTTPAEQATLPGYDDVNGFLAANAKDIPRLKAVALDQDPLAALLTRGLDGGTTHLQRSFNAANHSTSAALVAGSLTGSSLNYYLGQATVAPNAIFDPPTPLARNGMSWSEWNDFYTRRLLIPVIADGLCQRGACKGHCDPFGIHATQCVGASAGDLAGTSGKGLLVQRHDAAMRGLVNGLNAAARPHRVQYEKEPPGSAAMNVGLYLQHQAPPAPPGDLFADAVVKLAQALPPAAKGTPQFFNNAALAAMAAAQPPAAQLPLKYLALDGVIHAVDPRKGAVGCAASTAFNHKVANYAKHYVGVNEMTFMPIASDAAGVMDPRSVDCLRRLCSNGGRDQSRRNITTVLRAWAYGVQAGNAALRRAYLHHVHA